MTNDQLAGARPEPKQPATLRKGAIGLWDSTIIAISSTAPAYSLAASMAAMVLAVGLTSPLVVAIAFVPVMGIAIAFSYLNRANPNCGTSFSWVSEALGPDIGFMAGWASLAACVVFMVSASSLAGSYTLNLLGQLGVTSAGLANEQPAVVLAGSLWFAFVTFMVVYGIAAAARFQRFLLAIEYFIVTGFSCYALVRAYGSDPVPGSRRLALSWFFPSHIGGVSAFIGGALVAVFFYWGWDTAANINEETENATENPGKAGILSMFALLLIFLLGVTALQVTLSQDAIKNNADDSLAIFAKALFPRPWNYLMTLAILSSSVATLQTTLLPSARVTLSMSRERVLPAVLAVISPRFRTPWIATLFLAGLSFAGLAAGIQAASVNTFLTNSVGQVGVLVSVYYGLTGIACTVLFRSALLKSIRTFMLAGVMATGGGLFMLFMGGYSVWDTVSTSGWGTEAPVLVSLALGIPFLLLARRLNPAHFRRSRAGHDRGKAETTVTAVA